MGTAHHPDTWHRFVTGVIVCRVGIVRQSVPRPFSTPTALCPIAQGWPGAAGTTLGLSRPTVSNPEGVADPPLGSVMADQTMLDTRHRFSTGDSNRAAPVRKRWLRLGFDVEHNDPVVTGRESGLDLWHRFVAVTAPEGSGNVPARRDEWSRGAPRRNSWKASSPNPRPGWGGGFHCEARNTFPSPPPGREWSCKTSTTGSATFADGELRSTRGNNPSLLRSESIRDRRKNLMGQSLM